MDDDLKPASNKKEPKDWSKSFVALFIPIVVAIISALGAVIVGYLNYIKAPDAPPKPTVVAFFTYLRAGTYLGAKAVLNATASPTVLGSQLPDRVGQLAANVAIVKDGEWSAGSSGSNRIIKFTFALRALPQSQQTNGSVSFVVKRDARTICNGVLNTKVGVYAQVSCSDQVPAGLEAIYKTNVLTDNVSVGEVSAISIQADKF